MTVKVGFFYMGLMGEANSKTQRYTMEHYLHQTHCQFKPIGLQALGIGIFMKRA